MLPKKKRGLQIERKLTILSLTIAITYILLYHFGSVDLNYYLDAASYNKDTSIATTDEFVPEFVRNETFPGAREWHDYWTNTQQKGDDNRTLIRDAHMHDEYVISTAQQNAFASLQYINEMKVRYKDVNGLADFYARGLGWVYNRLGMVLTVVVTSSSSSNTKQSILIVDTVGTLKCGTAEEDESWIDKQPPLSMWVRANGPEIYAGTAIPHKLKKSSLCCWRYDFEPTSPGTYSIHVKVLNYNGFVDSLNATCVTENLPSGNDHYNQQDNQFNDNYTLEDLETLNAKVVEELAIEGNYSHHRGMLGFKMYGPVDACCEACKRAPGCKMFSIPGALHFDECELYFGRIEDDIDYIDRDSGQYLGRNRSYEYTTQNPGDFPFIRRRRRLAIATSQLKKKWPVNVRPMKGSPPVSREVDTYFIGCGWSSLMAFENPCMYPSDDLVYGSGITIDIKETITSDNQVNITKRLCNLDDERFDISSGRWVRYPFPDDSVCLPMEKAIGAEFKTYTPKLHIDRPASCWHRDDLTQIGNTCAEPGCKFVVEHRWQTSLKKENKWYGKWEQHGCDYLDLEHQEIQTCVDKKGIKSITVAGLSISGIIKGYLLPKLKNITMVESSKMTVVLDTLKMPHILWGRSLDNFRKELEAFPTINTVDKTEERRGSKADSEHFFVSGFYYTSEREPHVTLDRSLQYSKLAYDILNKKGYKMINALDVTSAFAYDTDTQADGMHIAGKSEFVLCVWCVQYEDSAFEYFIRT